MLGSLYSSRPWRLALSLSLLALAGCAQVRAVRTEVADKLGGSSSATPAPNTAGEAGPPLSLSAITNTYLQHGRYAEGEQRLHQYLARYPNDRAAQNLLRQLTADPRSVLGTASRNYTVQAGDSYSTLAARYLGDAGRFLILARYNGSANPAALRAGDVVRLPSAVPAATEGDTLVVHAADAAPPASAPASDASPQQLQAESSALLRQGRKSGQAMPARSSCRPKARRCSGRAARATPWRAWTRR